MASCERYSHTSSDPSAPVHWKVYEVVNGVPIDECGKSLLDEKIVLSAFEYQELSVLAGQTTSIDQAVAALDPGEMSAVFGICFGFVMFLGYIGYQIRVGKNLINKA